MNEHLAEGFRGERAIITPYPVRGLLAAGPVTRQLYLTHIGYYPKAKYHYREREAGATEHILIYCERGRGWIELDGERSVLSRNMFFILPPGRPHAYGADRDEPWSIYWLHFHGENVGMFSPIIGRPRSLDSPEEGRRADRLALFEEMYRNLEMGYGAENLEHISFCLMYFLSSMKYVSQYEERTPFDEGDVVRRTIGFMRDNVERCLSLERIAGAVGYSASHLSALFSARMSYSPMAYYNQLRIRRGCHYLQFTTLKIKEIAFRLGYYDPFHFSGAFRRGMGLTPKAYRARYQTEALREGKNRNLL